MFDISRVGQRFGIGVLTVVFAASAAIHATQVQPLDLDTTSGAESQCELTVNTSSPVTVINTVINRAMGNTFDFAWPSAGPGGLTGNIPGATTESPAKSVEWTWTTVDPLRTLAPTPPACAADICFGQTVGSIAATSSFCSLACKNDAVSMATQWDRTAGRLTLTWSGGSGPFTLYRSTSPRGVDDAPNALPPNSSLPNTPPTAASPYAESPPAGVTFYYKIRSSGCVTPKSCSTAADCSVPGDGFCITRGPFGAPGRSLYASYVTISTQTLTSTLVRTFSPTTEIFRATSTANAAGVLDVITAGPGQTITVTTPGVPEGCCPVGQNPEDWHQLNCSGECVHWRTDEDNCGACGNVCSPGFYCSYGECVLPCDEGQTFCGVSCVSTWSDPNNCGDCHHVCPSGYSCYGGQCESPCDAGQEFCDDQCVFLDDDHDHCGSCDNACGEFQCCVGGECADLECYGGEELCGGQCYDLNDPSHCGGCDNVCAANECCEEGSCVSSCAEGEAPCGETCCAYDEVCKVGGCYPACGGDDEFCDGECCGAGTCCAKGYCEPLTCGNAAFSLCPGTDTCANTFNDPDNCGTCGHACAAGTECCWDGVCHSHQEEVCGGQSTSYPGYCPYDLASAGGGAPNTKPAANAAFGGSCPAPPPPHDPFCPYPAVNSSAHQAEDAAPALLVVLGGGKGGPDEAPACIIDPSTTPTIVDGASATHCTPWTGVFKEYQSAIRVCGNGVPGVDGECAGETTKVTTGTFNRLVPDPSINVDPAYVTPFSIRVVSDSSGNGLLEPGETGTLVIEVLNAGPAEISDTTATLEGPPVDLTYDGTDNPVGLTVAPEPQPVSFGPIPGAPAGPFTDCIAPAREPSSDDRGFKVTVPPEHPGDTSRPLLLTIDGMAAGAAFHQAVPLSLGIGDGCEYDAHARKYDGVFGMQFPMARLVREGQTTASFPTRTFPAGDALQFEMGLSCGGIELSDSDIDAPVIVALTKDGVPIDVSTLVESHTQRNTTTFSWVVELDDDLYNWTYGLETSGLGTGSFVLTVRVAGRDNYVTGFVLR